MADVAEFPKWVPVVDGLIQRKGDVVAVPEFSQWHVTRDGKVMVLADNADDELRAAGNARPTQQIEE